MPIYDYVCARCDEVTEVIHGIHAQGPRFCPACGADGTLRKGITTSAVHFKGSGWAKKDRAATAAPGPSKAAKSSSVAGDTSGDSAKAGDAAPPAPTTPVSTAATNGGD